MRRRNMQWIEEAEARRMRALALLGEIAVESCEPARSWAIVAADGWRLLLNSAGRRLENFRPGRGGGEAALTGKAGEAAAVSVERLPCEPANGCISAEVILFAGARSDARFAARSEAGASEEPRPLFKAR